MMLERQQGASGGPGVVRKEGRKEVQKKGKKQRKETVVRGSRTNRGRKVDQRQWEKEGSWRRGRKLVGERGKDRGGKEETWGGHEGKTEARI